MMMRHSSRHYLSFDKEIAFLRSLNATAGMHLIGVILSRHDALLHFLVKDEMWVREESGHNGATYTTTNNTQNKIDAIPPARDQNHPAFVFLGTINTQATTDNTEACDQICKPSSRVGQCELSLHGIIIELTGKAITGKHPKTPQGKNGEHDVDYVHDYGRPTRVTAAATA